jgi:hypothetical protein
MRFLLFFSRKGIEIKVMLSVPTAEKKKVISILQKETNIFTNSQRIKKCCTLKHLSQRMWEKDECNY